MARAAARARATTAATSLATVFSPAVLATGAAPCPACLLLLRSVMQPA